MEAKSGWRMYEIVEGIALSAVAAFTGGGGGGGVAQTPHARKPKLAPVHIGDVSIRVTPVRPDHGERAEIETYHDCQEAGNKPEADLDEPLAERQSYSRKDTSRIWIDLEDGLEKGSTVCVVERIYGKEDKDKKDKKDKNTVRQIFVSDPQTASAASETEPSDPIKKPLIDQVYIEDGAIVVTPVLPRKHERATIATYGNCDSSAKVRAVDQYARIATLQAVAHNDRGPFIIQLDHRLSEKDTVCVVEYFYNKDNAGNRRVRDQRGIDKASRILVAKESQATTKRQADGKASFPSTRSYRTYARVTTGTDVSAAASADPAAHFMADLSFDVPFSNHNGSLYRTFNADGYIRMASIAQPGMIKGVATPATYIKPLTDSTPNDLVQSWEGDVALAWKVNKRAYLGEQDAYWTTSAIVDGGFITPISANQTATVPVVCKANSAIYDFYTKTPVVNAAAAKAISDACVIPASGPFPMCYVSYIPQDRTRFFRNYAVGVTFKRYRYQGEDNGKTRHDTFDFPGQQPSKSVKTST